MLNRPAQINDEAIARLPQVPINHQLVVFPTEKEVHKAIKQMSTGKAPESDATPLEIYIEGAPIAVTQLTNLYNTCDVKNNFLKNSEILRLSTSTSVKAIVSLAL